VERIIASEAFKRSPRQQELLRYLTERTLSGSAERITEQSIGQDVFGRNVGYNPAEDNIVRVAARQLRARLQEYFSGEGRAEAWLLEVPKGHYVPELRPAPAHTGAAGDATPPGGPSATSGRRRYAFLLLVAFVLATASYLAGRLGGGGAAEPAPRTGAPALLAALFPGRQSINVVLPDTILVLLHSLTGHVISLNEYSRHEPELSTLGLPAAEMARWSDLESMPLTSVADATFAANLIRSASTLRERIRILHARQVSTPTFRTDDAILLGGPRVNPWVELFERDLNFRFRYPNRGQHGCIVNTQPKDNEPREYGDCSNLEEIVYARLAWVPNLDGSGHVLLVGGTGMEASQAGCDFLLHSANRSAVLALTGARSFGDLDSFELLLRTTRKAGAPTVPSMVAWRARLRRP
jgi:hypothetical protein